MRANEIRELSDDEVTTRLAELERERFNLRFKAGTQALEDPLRMRAVRKELARLKTIQRERALGVVREAAPAPRSTRKGTARKSAAGTTAARKTAARKTAARKTAARKTAARKSASGRGRTK